LIKKLAALLAAALVAGGLSAVATTTPALAAPANAPRETIQLIPSVGTDIYTPPGGVGYSYGPSLMFESSVLRMYTCIVDPGNPWDMISYQSSTDGGGTWTAQQTALVSTVEGADSGSVCDPSVIKWDGYYYLAYTGIVKDVASGWGNEIFVARSTNPAGPFDRWNGSGWGGNPAPIVTPPSTGYGVGEPSLVVVGEKLYLYYSFYDDVVAQTRLMTADMAGTAIPTGDWPNHLSDGGVAIDRTGKSSNIGVLGGGDLVEDSTDVKWVPGWNKFIGIATSDRFSVRGNVKLYESTDGKHFTEAIASSGDWQFGMHNIGISGNALGQISPSGYNVIAYAYGGVWGGWSTHLSPVTLGRVNTGSVNLSMISASTAGNWVPLKGTWAMPTSSAQYLSQTSETTHPAYATIPTIAFGDATYEMDVKVLNTGQNWAGLNINKVTPADSYGQGGYLVFLRGNGKVSLYKGAVDGAGVVVSDVPTGTSPSTGWVHLRVVHSHGTVYVYVGDTTVPQIKWSDPGGMYIGGSMSLVTSMTKAQFKNLVISDNVSPSFQASDWSAFGGAWSLPTSGQVRNASTGTMTGRNTLMSTSSTGVTTPWAGGDGAYHAEIKMDPTAGDDSTAGVSITANGLSIGNWLEGYRISLSGDGWLNMDNYSGGSVPLADPRGVLTGLDARSASVDLRIVRGGKSVQVFVNDSVLPIINYMDPSPPSGIGSFGLFSNTPTTFTEVSYAANGSWPH
jgi:hypothetical protein